MLVSGALKTVYGSEPGYFQVSIARVILLFFLSVIVSCQQQEPQPPPPLLTVGQRQVTLPQFEQELARTYPDISGLTAEEQFQLKGQLLKQLIDRELILGEASRLNIQLTPDELDAAMVEVRGSYTKDEFSRILEQTGNTEERWLEALKLRLLTTKVSAAVLTQVKVSEKEAEEYYKKHRDEFRRPAEIRARQMLFKTREKAKEVRQLLLAGGDFAALARKFSQSPDRENGGSLGYFSAGQLPVEFDEILFKLPVRQVSEPVETSYGFHLFLVERKRRAGLRPYAAVKGEIIAKLSQQKEEAAFHRWLENLQKSTKTKINWDLLRKQSE